MAKGTEFKCKIARNQGIESCYRFGDSKTEGGGGYLELPAPMLRLRSPAPTSPPPPPPSSDARRFLQKSLQISTKRWFSAFGWSSSMLTPRELAAALHTLLVTKNGACKRSTRGGANAEHGDPVDPPKIPTNKLLPVLKNRSTGKHGLLQLLVKTTRVPHPNTIEVSMELEWFLAGVVSKDDRRRMTATPVPLCENGRSNSLI
uniref:Uncharacterized protein n=1 Tax=Oryza brachyantha TaxID=4533 RepID=J3LG05_ORYBR